MADVMCNSDLNIQYLFGWNKQGMDTSKCKEPKNIPTIGNGIIKKDLQIEESASPIPWLDQHGRVN